MKKILAAFAILALVPAAFADTYVANNSTSTYVEDSGQVGTVYNTMSGATFQVTVPAPAAGTRRVMVVGP